MMNIEMFCRKANINILPLEKGQSPLENNLYDIFQKKTRLATKP